jgi:hypothetical protein
MDMGYLGRLIYSARDTFTSSCKSQQQPKENE